VEIDRKKAQIPAALTYKFFDKALSRVVPHLEEGCECPGESRGVLFRRSAIGGRGGGVHASYLVFINLFVSPRCEVVWLMMMNAQANSEHFPVPIIRDYLEKKKNQRARQHLPPLMMM